jgi:hypothetical protein
MRYSAVKSATNPGEKKSARMPNGRISPEAKYRDTGEDGE